MKIIRAETFLTNVTEHEPDASVIKPFLFVCLETDEGIRGWGEAFITAENKAIVESKIQIIANNIIQLDWIDAKVFYGLYAEDIEAAGFDYACAVSAIEIALWDLQGKKLGQPVRELLGDLRREKVPVYANTWTGNAITIDSLVSQCQQLVSRGFNAIKIYPLKYGGAQEAGECVKRVRHSVGDAIDILIDISAISDPELAINCAKAIAPYKPYWFEEPHTGDDPKTLASIRRQTELRIVTGEKQVGRTHFKNVLELKAVDILNPDISACGGLIEIQKIGVMAEKYAVSVSPHCWNSMTVSFAAMLHVCSVLENADKAEVFPSYLDFGSQFSQVDYDIKEGFAILGSTPGLGVEIDIGRLRNLSSSQVVQCN